jgi:lipoprotein-releasing system ATP-binding protein
MPATGAGLHVTGLGKTYPAPGEPLVAVRDVNFDLAPGESLAIMGPSGSGKSTLLYMLGTLERPTSGEIRLDSEDPFGLDPGALAVFRGRKVGFIFQDHHLLPQCTALENVLIPTLADGASGDRTADERRARELLERVGLAGRLEHLPGELSGGERQRVALARALIRRPALLLADEPTGNLDRKAAAAAADLILELQREAGSVLALVTHSAELAARFPRRAELVDGGLTPA